MQHLEGSGSPSYIKDARFLKVKWTIKKTGCLRKLNGPNKKELSGGCSKLNAEEVKDFDFSKYYAGNQIKGGEAGRAVVLMKRRKCGQGFSIGSSKRDKSRNI
jgi:hypothetical protein